MISFLPDEMIRGKMVLLISNAKIVRDYLYSSIDYNSLIRVHVKV